MNLVPFRPRGSGKKGGHNVVTFVNTEDQSIHRRCGVCKEINPIEHYPEGSGDKNFGRLYRCRECHNNRTNELALYLWNKFGITKAEYEEKLAGQDGKCAICICTSDKRLAVDHCHETGQIRSLLCYKCNTMLGNANDRPEILEKAAEYLREHRAKQGQVVQTDTNGLPRKSEVQKAGSRTLSTRQRASASRHLHVQE